MKIIQIYRDGRIVDCSGFNFRMNEMQGAVGIAQLKKLDFVVGKQRENSTLIRRRLNPIQLQGEKSLKVRLKLQML